MHEPIPLTQYYSMKYVSSLSWSECGTDGQVDTEHLYIGYPWYNIECQDEQVRVLIRAGCIHTTTRHLDVFQGLHGLEVFHSTLHHNMTVYTFSSSSFIRGSIILTPDMTTSTEATPTSESSTPPKSRKSLVVRL